MENTLVGQNLGRYKLTALLGSGGMGDVYRGLDITLARPVAVKVIHSYLARNQAFQARFLQEAQLLASLEHPDIVKVLDAGQANQRLFIVSEYVNGGNMAEKLSYLRANRLWIDKAEAVTIVKHIARAVDYAHRSNVLHGDLKPANIMIEKIASADLPYHPVLTDLGLARLGAELGLAEPGIAMGTPAYMSPEQVLGNSIDHRSDIYSLGIILYELVTGTRPFSASTLSEAIRYYSVEPQMPDVGQSRLPTDLTRIIRLVLEKNPTERFQSAAEFAQALSQVDLTDLVGSVPTAASAGSSTLFMEDRSSFSVGRPTEVANDLFPVASGDKPQIQIRAQDGTVRSVTLTGKLLIIGSAESAQIVLSAPEISEKHARLEIDGETYTITDLNSTTGTYLDGLRLLGGVEQNWPPNQILQIGAFQLRLVPGSSTEVPTAVETDSGLGPRALTIELVTAHDGISIEPGQSVELEFRLINDSTIVDHYTLEAENVPADWIELPPEIRLEPGSAQVFILTLQLPRTSQATAGEHKLQVKVSSQTDPSIATTTAISLTVEPFVQYEARVEPQEARTGDKVRVEITNAGNTTLDLDVDWRSKTDEVDFEPANAHVVVPAGDTNAVDAFLRVRHRRIFGGTRRYPFEATVSAHGQIEPSVLYASVLSRGLIPTWFIALLALLIAFAAFVYYNSSNSTSMPPEVTETPPEVTETPPIQEDDEDANTEPQGDAETPEIIEVLRVNGFGGLVDAFTAADLIDVLEGEGPFTIFAPTDDAFAALPEGTLDGLLADPQGALTHILLYHVLPGKVMAADMTGLAGQTIETVGGGSLTVEVNDSGSIMINDVMIVKPNLDASNGVIHVIDAILVPEVDTTSQADVEPIENEEDDGLVDIFATIAKYDSLSDISRAIDDANLARTFLPFERYTVFAPTDDAFDQLPIAVRDKLFGSQYKLALAIQGHLIPQQLTFAQLLAMNGDEVAIGPNSLRIEVLADNTVRVSGLTDTLPQLNPSVGVGSEQLPRQYATATIIQPDIPASNGVIHIIDTTLVDNEYVLWGP